MAAPVLDTGTITTSIADGTSIDITMPSTVNADDLLIIIVGDDADNVTGNSIFNTPSGWTDIAENGDNTSDCWVHAFYKVADGTEDGTTVTVNRLATDECYGWGMRVTGVDTTTPIDVTGTSTPANESSHTIPEITTTVADCLVFYAHAFDGADGYPFSVSGTGSFTERGELESPVSGGGNDASGCWGTKTMSGTGGTGTAVIATSVSDGNAGIMFAVAPAAGDTTFTANAGSFTQANQSATVNADRSLTASAGAYTQANQNATVAADRAFTASAGAFTLTAYAATVSTASDTAFTANAGAFTKADQSATVTADRAFTASAGSLTQANQSATVTADRVVSAGAGAYTQADQNATVTADRAFTANAGAYTLTGYPATVSTSSDVAFTANAGSFTKADQGATVTADVTLTASSASYTLTGQSATVTAGSGTVVNASAASFTLTANAATVTFTEVVAASPTPAGGGGGVSADAWLERDRDYREERRRRQRLEAEAEREAEAVAAREAEKAASAPVVPLVEQIIETVPLAAQVPAPEIAGPAAIAAYIREHHALLEAQRLEQERIRREQAEEEAIIALVAMLAAA